MLWVMVTIVTKTVFGQCGQDLLSMIVIAGERENAGPGRVNFLTLHLLTLVS